MNNEKSYTYTIHQYLYVETQCKRKLHNDFSYMSLRITFIGSTNFLCSPTATGRRLQPPIFLRLQPEGSSNSPILWLQLEGGYNQKVATNTYPFPIQTTMKYKFQM
jgi:hypothetical protein